MNSPHSLAKYLATYITDRSTIAAHVSREFARPYTTSDINRMLSGEIIPRPPSALSEEPIAMHRPLRTNTGGVDALAVATNSYIERYADKIRRLAR
jgi:hypothetical protein